MQVERKRYICAIDCNDYDSLLPASKTSLKLQVSIFSEQAATKFIQQLYVKDRVTLRIRKCPA